MRTWIDDMNLGSFLDTTSQNCCSCEMGQIIMSDSDNNQCPTNQTGAGTTKYFCGHPDNWCLGARVQPLRRYDALILCLYQHASGMSRRISPLFTGRVFTKARSCHKNCTHHVVVCFCRTATSTISTHQSLCSCSAS